MATIHQFLLLYLPSLFLLLYTITQHFLNKLLNLPPYPFPILPIFGHLHFFSTSSTPFHRALAQISRRCGPILLLRLGRHRVLLVSSPSAAQECLVRNDVIFASRPNLLNGKHFGYNFTSLAWAPYGDGWRNLRRISTVELLSSRKLNALSGVRFRGSRALVKKLLAVGGNDDVDLRELFFEHVYSVVMRMITGGGEDAAAAEGWEVFGEIVAEMTAVTSEANVVDFVPFVGWLGFGDSVQRKMSLVQEKRERFMESVIEKHLRRRRKEEECGGGGGGGKERSLIEVLLDLQREEPEYYTDQTIRNLLLVLLQGATHASSTTLEWAFSHLLQNPHILTRARSHIDNYLVAEHHNYHRHLITESDVSQIPYLLHIVNETLRMHPPAPLLTPHLSSDECTVAGFRVPRGTILLVNAWDIQNNPDTWENPNEFAPERFEGLNIEGNNELEFLPFGLGRRACPGEKMAVVMVGAALGCLIQCFEWEKIGGGEIDMREGKGVITPRVQRLRAKCCPRPFVADPSFLKG